MSRIARAHLLDIDVDRPKWIDQYVDYFGEGKTGLFPRLEPQARVGMDQSPIESGDDVP